MREKRVSNFKALENHSNISFADNQISYWNVHLFFDEGEDNHGVDAYFQWNDDVFFIQIMPLDMVRQNLGIYIKTGLFSEYIDFLIVVDNKITKRLFENQLIKVCETIGLGQDYSYLKKRYSPNEKYKEIVK